MQLNTDLIKNKQRILIGGNRGADEIFQMVKTVLCHIRKPADFIELGHPAKLSDAPIVIIKGGDNLNNGKASFHDLNIHILLVHEVIDDLPDGYGTFNEYVDQYEQLADGLPKAGSYIFNEADDVALLMGKKEREDVKNIEYSALSTNELGARKQTFLEQAAGAKALLNRIGVSDEQFYAGLKAL